MFKWFSQKNKQKQVNFDEIVRQAKITKSEESMKEVWRTFYQLPEIFILLSPYQNDNSPYCAKLEDEKWFFVFTDVETLKSAAIDIIGNKKNVHFVKLSNETAIDWFEKWNSKGIYGIRVNQGENGIFTSIKDLIDRKNILNNF